MALVFSRWKPFLPAAAIALVAIAIAWGFSATTLWHTRSMGFPLDDSYIYLTYAKQFGRFQPFTYYPGGGYSAGATSVLWPMVLAPFWTLGARGHALVWVTFVLCAALYAAVAVGAYHFVRKLAGEVTGVIAAALVLASAPFAWCSLSGMEVALTSALLVGALILLARHEGGRPRRLLIICLTALGLARPETLVIVGGLCAASSVMRLVARDVRGALLWLVPLVPAALWLLANRIFAGHFFPNTGHVKSHFYLPGFDWTYWWQTFKSVTNVMRHALYWREESPLVWPRFMLVLQLVGSVRVLLWARREQRWLAGIVAVLSPLVILFSVIATSGEWTFQNYRYIAPMLPLVAILAACALAPPVRWPALVEFFAPILRRVWLAIALIVVAVYCDAAYPRQRADMRMYAQNVSDTNLQVVRIGHFIHDKLPGARVMVHDAGAIAYYSDTPVYDMLGLVTNFQADVANNGPGARFEFLESLPPDERPTHFAYYPGWMGSLDWFGDVLLGTPLYQGFEKRRLVGDADMEVLVANFDHVHTAERPFNAHDGWQMVDRVDIADVASERTHDWYGAMGRRRFAEKSARWSIVEREVTEAGLVIDGGRTIREGSERFTVTLDPKKPARIVFRTGGAPLYLYHEAIEQPITLELLADDHVLGKLTVPVPEGKFSELTFNLPANAVDHSPVELHTRASGTYRVFHWFVLQPE